MNLSLDLELPRSPSAVAQVRRAISSVCRNAGVRPPDIDDLNTAVSEACNNVVTHANRDDTFTVTLHLTANRARVLVTNTATSVGEDVYDVRDPVDPMAESGRGLAIMRAVMDEAHIIPRPNGGTTVELIREFR